MPNYKISNPDVYAIMVQTTGGKKVFRYYGIPAEEMIPSPFRPKDKSASLIIKRCPKSGKYRFYEIINGVVFIEGDVIDFVQCKFNLGFRDAVVKIRKDLKII